MVTLIAHSLAGHQQDSPSPWPRSHATINRRRAADELPYTRPVGNENTYFNGKSTHAIQSRQRLLTSSKSVRVDLWPLPKLPQPHPPRLPPSYPMNHSQSCPPYRLPTQYMFAAPMTSSPDERSEKYDARPQVSPLGRQRGNTICQTIVSIAVSQLPSHSTSRTTGPSRRWCQCSSTQCLARVYYKCSCVW